MKLNGTHQLFIYANDGNIMGRKDTYYEEKQGNLIVASKENELEENADKTKYMVMSGDQNAGRSHNIKTHNSSFEIVEDFKYLGTTLTNQNSTQEEIKSR